MTIDAHQHFWQFSNPFDYRWLDVPKHAPIKRDFLPQDLQPLIKAAGIDRTVCVQTQHSLAETRWMLKLAQDHPFIAGVVGWVNLAAPECEEQLLRFKEDAKFVGIRHVTQDEPDDDFIVREDVLRGLKVLEKHGMPFDLLFYVKHLHHVPALARRLPTLPMVLDHLAKPHIREGKIDDWLPHFRAAAAFPNVFCKLSGMVTEADWHRWTVDDLKPYVRTALECFTPARLMFGSDWPVCTLAGAYGLVYGALMSELGAISDSDQAEIFGGTAARFYHLRLD
jgi:L-fuconolactonase